MLAREVKDDFEIYFQEEEKFSSLITDSGFQTFSAEKFDADEVLKHSQKFSFGWMNESLLEKIFLSQCNAIKNLNPDFVLGDVSFTLKTAAEKCGVKMIALINGYMSKHYSLTRKISRTHPAYHYSQKLPEKFFDALTQKMEALAFRKVHAPFRSIRKKYGLKKVKHYLEELEGDSTLICDLPDLFPQKKMPDHFTFIGPLFYEGNEEEQKVLSQLQHEKKTILVSLGSSGDWNALRFLNEEKFSCFNIITAGDEMQILNAPLIMSKKFLNNMAVLPHCNLVICHGGNGTIYQALSCGIPLLAHTSIFEQEWNVQRLHSLGLGQSINDCSDSEELLKTIELWMEKKIDAKIPGQISEFKKNRRETLLGVIEK